MPERGSHQLQFSFSKALGIDFHGLSKLNNLGLFSLSASGTSLGQPIHFFFVFPTVSFMRGRIRHTLSIQNKDGPWISMLVMMTIPVLLSSLERCLTSSLLFDPDTGLSSFPRAPSTVLYEFFDEQW